MAIIQINRNKNPYLLNISTLYIYILFTYIYCYIMNNYICVYICKIKEGC